MTNRSMGRAPSRRAAVAPVLAVAAAVAVGVGCTRPAHWPPTHKPPTTTPTTGVAAHSVNVQLADHTITFDADVAAGRNTVTIKNTGTHKHEVIFIKADSAKSLPTKSDGSVDEMKLPRGSDIGEAEVESGASATKTFSFTPGKWVAVCNVDEAGHSHFAMGMYREFTVA